MQLPRLFWWMIFLMCCAGLGAWLWAVWVSRHEEAEGLMVEKESKPFKPRVEPSERFARSRSDWENVNSPETYRLLTEARDYFLIPGVIKRRDPRLA